MTDDATYLDGSPGEAPPLSDDDYTGDDLDGHMLPIIAPRSSPPDATDDPDDPGSSVRPANLAAIIDGGIVQVEADRLERDDGQHLAYSGRANGLQGEPESGKTWVAFIAMVLSIHAGRRVVFVDYEDTAGSAIERLRALGLSDHQIVTHLSYYGREQLEGRPAELVVASIKQHPVADVVLDSVGEFLALYGLDENSAPDILRFRSTWVTPLLNHGATVWLIDHVAKDRESRGKYARGSGAKLAMMDGAVYTVRSDGFNRTTAGRIKLTLQKDRHGSIPGTRGDLMASLYMAPNADGSLRYSIDAPLPATTDSDTSDPDAALRTTMADQIVRILDLDGQLSTSKIGTALRADRGDDLTAVKFGNGLEKTVLEELRARGLVAMTNGPRGSDLWALPPEQMTLSEER